MAALSARLLFCLTGAVLLAQAASIGGYVGSKTCFGCHPATYRSFQKTSMGRSMTLPSDWSADSLPREATVKQPGTLRVYSVSRDSSGWKQSESDPGVFSVDRQLDFVVGSGSNGLTFLIRRGSFLFQAPLSYYSRPHKWDLSPGYETVDLGFSRKVPQECINCHAGRPALQTKNSEAYADPPFQELAVGCENCHGPGEAHVRSAGKSRGSIVNPAKLTARLAENICLGCHQSGDARVAQPGKSYLDFRPGQWLFDTAVIFKIPAKPGQGESDLLEHFSSMQASRCYRESTGKLNCLTCHDPHVQPPASEAPAYYRPKCLSCHSETSCRIPTIVRKAQTPPDNCIGCHMSKRDVTQISHSALTNHRIPGRANEPTPALAQSSVADLVVVDPPGERQPALSKIVLLRAYKQLSQKDSDYRNRYSALLNEVSKTDTSDSFVQAALGDRAFGEGRTEEAIEHLKSALPAEDPAIYQELGECFAKLGQTQDAIEYLKKGVALDPFNAVMLKTLILQYINAKSYSEARVLMQNYVEIFPEDGFMRGLLARVSK
jgi:hypothetical protein